MFLAIALHEYVSNFIYFYTNIYMQDISTDTVSILVINVLLCLP